MKCKSNNDNQNRSAPGCFFIIDKEAITPTIPFESEPKPYIINNKWKIADSLSKKLFSKVRNKVGIAPHNMYKPVQNKVIEQRSKMTENMLRIFCTFLIIFYTQREVERQKTWESFARKTVLGINDYLDMPIDS